jgi:hypothetical protein
MNIYFAKVVLTKNATWQVKSSQMYIYFQLMVITSRHEKFVLVIDYKLNYGTLMKHSFCTLNITNMASTRIFEII